MGWMATTSRFYFEGEEEAEAEGSEVRARGGSARVYRRETPHPRGRSIHTVPEPYPRGSVATAEEGAVSASTTRDSRESSGPVVRALQERLGKAAAGASGQQAWPLRDGWWALRPDLFVAAVGNHPRGRQLLADAGLLSRVGAKAYSVVVQRDGSMERVYKVRLSGGS